MTIASVIVQSLVAAGVKRIHGLTGDSLNSIIDEVRRTPEIDFIHYRHEEAAAFAASAEAQLTGELAVCAGSCGPGNLHLINGLFDAHRSGARVLAIAAHIPSSEVGTGYFQETHPQNLFQECSHYCELISSAKQMPRVLATAMQTAISKEGVAVVCISGDVAVEKVHDTKFLHNVARPTPVIRPSDGELQIIADALNRAGQVTILAGRGCAGQSAHVQALAAVLQAPIVSSLRGKEHLEPANPYYIGLTGLIGFPQANDALQSAQVVLMLGTDFPYKDWYPKEATIIQIDRAGERLGRHARVTYGVVGEIEHTIPALLPLITPKTDESHLHKHRKAYEQIITKIAPKEDSGLDYIHPELICTILADMADRDAVFTADVGTPTVWAARNLRMRAGQRLLGSFNHGSMACALPMAIGAQVTQPNRQVISLSGDGGFAMLMGDILTIAQYKLPVKIIIFNNASLGFVAMEMKVAGLPPYGTDLANPDFAKLAEAVGIAGYRADRPDNLREALHLALTTPGPALVDVRVNKEELSLPPAIQAEQAAGFSLYMMKETARGNLGSVIDTIKSNFID